MLKRLVGARQHLPFRRQNGAGMRRVTGSLAFARANNRSSNLDSGFTAMLEACATPRRIVKRTDFRKQDPVVVLFQISIGHTQGGLTAKPAEGPPPHR
jgi:hypothetical protein